MGEIDLKTYIYRITRRTRKDMKVQNIFCTLMLLRLRAIFTSQNSMLKKGDLCLCKRIFLFHIKYCKTNNYKILYFFIAFIKNNYVYLADY